MSEWKEGILTDVAEIVMGQSPKGETCNTNFEGLPLLNGPTEFGIKNPTAIQYTTDAKRVSITNDLLFCVRGSTTGRMNWSNKSYAIGRGLAAIRHKKGDDYKFFLKSIIDYNLPYLLQSASGSTFPNVSKNQLEGLEIQIPPLPEQKAIAEVLSSLDDKIDLLHRQNKTLEQMAETLFRQWFVEETKEDWEVDEIKNYVEVVDNRGKTPPNSIDKTPYPLIEVNALGKENRLVDYSVIRKYVDKETFENWFRNKPKKYDTLLSTVGSIGAISMYLIEKGNVAQNVIGLCAKNISVFYLFQFLKHQTNEILLLDIGGVQPSIKVPHLLSLDIPIPPFELQKKFDIQVLDFVSKMENNYIQIRNLEKMRDTLLPKLMSGEVKIS